LSFPEHRSFLSAFDPQHISIMVRIIFFPDPERLGEPFPPSQQLLAISAIFSGSMFAFPKPQQPVEFFLSLVSLFSICDLLL
jgi:hypothetical protein